MGLTLFILTDANGVALQGPYASRAQAEYQAAHTPTVTHIHTHRFTTVTTEIKPCK